MIEYVDHLHEHFVDPVVIRGGSYLLPSPPGYSAQIRPESLARVPVSRTARSGPEPASAGGGVAGQLDVGLAAERLPVPCRGHCWEPSQ